MISKEYRELFQLAARNGALNAENAVEALKIEEGHKKEIDGLLEMRNKFNILEDKITKAEEELALVDYILLYAGAMVSRNIINKNVTTWTSVVKEYDENLLPKLKEVTQQIDSEKRQTLIEEFFGNEN